MRIGRLLWMLLLSAIASDAVGATRPRDVALLRVSTFGIDLDSRLDYQGASVERPFLESDSWSRTFTSGLTFSSTGSVYHPRLLSYSGSVRLAFSRLDRGGSGADIDRNGTIDDYDLTLRLFGQSSLSAFYFARRSRNRQRSRGLGDQDFSRELQRVQLNWRNRIMPIQTQWSRENFDTEGIFESREKRRNFLVEGARAYRSGLTRITYANEDYENFATSTRTETERVEVQQNLQAGSRVQLGTSLYWLDQRVFTRRINKRASGTLRIRLSRNLSSFSRVSTYRIEESGSDTDRIEGETSLDHRLYESLDTRLWIYGFREDSPLGRIERRDVLGSVSYRKRVPFGRIRYGFTLKDVRQDNRLDFAELSVFDTPFTFGVDDRILFPHPDVLVETIRVVDANGVIPYTEGVDYTVEVLGSQVGILRVVTGAIPRGSTVLVSYRYRADGRGSGGFQDRLHQVGADLPAGFRVDHARGTTDPRYLSGARQDGIFSGNLSRWDLRWQRGVYDVLYRNVDQVLNGRRNEEERLDASVRTRTVSGVALVIRAMVGSTRYEDGPRLGFRNLAISAQRDQNARVRLGIDAYLTWEELDSGDRTALDLRLRSDFRVGLNVVRATFQYVRSDAEALGLQKDTGVRVEFERKIR